jgi:hypothetical protein
LKHSGVKRPGGDRQHEMGNRVLGATSVAHADDDRLKIGQAGTGEVDHSVDVGADPPHLGDGRFIGEVGNEPLG